MKSLLEKLATLADELDLIESPDMADEVDSLMKQLPFAVKEPSIVDEVAHRAKQQEGQEGICATCGGSGAGIDEPWCEDCNGTGQGDFIVEASINKLALKPPFVRRRGNKWVVLDKHNGKVLSEHKTQDKANGALKAMHARKG